MTTKTSGLGDDWYVAGNRVGPDTQQLTIASPVALLDVTDITQSGHSRIPGLRDGSMEATVYFDPASGAAHDVFKALPTADVITTYLRGQAIGNPAACSVSKQLNYDPTRAASGEFTFKIQTQGNGFGLEWGQQLTAGLRTDTTATNGASYDSAGGASAPSVPASGTPATNPARIAATVVVSGGTVTNVIVNGVSVGSGDGTYTVPGGASITLTYSAAPTWTWTWQTVYGAQGYLQATALIGSTATVTIQHSPDNVTWSTLIAFTAVTSAPGAQRATVSNTTTVGRYLRAITTGTFTSFSFVAVLNRNQTPGVVF